MKKILALFFALLISTNIYAFRYAYTLSSKTIVYADRALNIPIGYIKAGRKLQVADKSFKRGSIVGLVVTGRVAYVKTKDLKFDLDGEKLSGTPTVKEHDVQILFMTDEDKLKENNFLALEMSQTDGGEEWDELNSDFDDTVSSDLTSFQIKIEHRSPKKDYGFSFGLSYLTSTAEGGEVKSILGDAEYQKRFFQSTLFSLEAYGGLSLSGDIQIKAKSGEISKGIAVGYNVGGRVRLFPFSKYGLYAGFGLKSLSLKSMTPIETPLSEVTLRSLGGPQISVGVHYKL